ncbi:MAG: trimethylamine methyltransferase [Desulfitibacter sp. BRH_c19]|nr:MAG: trimethylamine methyltransferase [Desulfitibacter sp. BRH_c19]
MLEGGLTYDYAQIVMDCEMIKMIRKVIGGIEVNQETLAVDVISQVGPAGEFMSHAHTFRHYKAEQSQSKLIDRNMRSTWLANGGKDFTERAYEKARYILENHKPEALSEGVKSKIRDIIEEANGYYGLKDDVR